jgi:tetratricopeptide (TPR) repeat protein
MKELVERLLDLVEKKIGQRQFIELLVLLLLVSGSVLLVTHLITAATAIAAAFWMPVGLWYVWSVYRNRFPPKWKKGNLLLAIVLSGAWAVWCTQFLTRTHREIVKDLNDGKDDMFGGEFTSADGKFAKALDLARTSGDEYRSAESLLYMGEAEFMLEEGKPEHVAKATEDFNQAFSLTDDPRLKAQIRVAQARADNYAGLPNQADQHLADAMNFAQELSSRDRLLEAAIRRMQGGIENRALNREAAIASFRDARKLYAEESQRMAHWRRLSWDWIRGEHTERDALSGQAEISLELGDLEGKVGQFEDARKDDHDAIVLFSQIHQTQEEAYALVSLGMLDTMTNQIKEARVEFGTAQGLYANDPEGQADVYFNLGEIDRVLGNNESSSWDYGKAVELYGAKDDVDRVNVYVGLALLETAQGYYADADRDLKKAEELAPAAAEPLGKNLALEARAELDTELGGRDKISEANQDYKTIRDFFHSIGNQWGEADALLHLGRWQSRFGDPKVKEGEAGKNYDTAFSLFQKEEMPIGEAEVLYSKAESERAAGKLGQAVTHYSDARKIYESDPDNVCKIGKANVLLGLGEVSSAQGRTEEAREYYGEARGLYVVQKSRIGEANVDLAEGMLSDASGKPGDKLANLNEAHALYLAMGKSDKVHEVELLLAKSKTHASARK